MSREDAREIAIRALSFLAGDAEHMSRFLALSGMGPQDIRENADEAPFQAALLEHLMSDEALLLSFCGNENIDPQLISPALHLLED
ncbi:MAG: DUF3572 domain-containing protein [Hyphomicrobiaceae bacterium]|nr:DUF3572 domain-containing protein [Hyphomicrobiaceae bacterium]